MPVNQGRRGFLHVALGTALVPDDVAPISRMTVSSRRVLGCGDIRTPCAVGRGGVRLEKREGDGATPAGIYPLRLVLFRQDRVSVRTLLPARPIARDDGWCTDPNDPNYNLQIALPRPGRHETLWRNDNLYDIVVVIGYNDAPVVPGKGSAIFLHIARPEMSPTDGCIAIPSTVLLEVIRRCDTSTFIEIAR